MSPVAMTMEAAAGDAFRLDMRQLADRFPFLVDEWLVTTGCGHPECQVVVMLSSLDQQRNREQVPPLLRYYTHLLQVHANRGDVKVTPDMVSGDVGFPTSLMFSQPIAVADDAVARAVCHQVVRDILAGILRAQPQSRDEVSTWQMAIVMAQMANRSAVAGHTPRIDPHKVDPDRDATPLGGGFAIPSARPWVGQDQEEVRDREHG